MGYIRAEEILPLEIIELVQQYVDGENIYIPRRTENRREWGQNTRIRQELSLRNAEIYEAYRQGFKVPELAERFFLSEKSIQRIVREMKERE